MKGFNISPCGVRYLYLSKINTNKMKKLIALFAPALLLVACNSVEQFRAPIEALATDWDKVTASVTETGGMIGAAQASLASLNDSLMVDPKLAAKMKPEASASLDSIKAGFASQLEGIGGLASEVAAFTTSWGELTTKLNTLKEGLAAGKLEGDVMAQIDELKNAVVDATSKSEGWVSKLNDAKASAMAAYDMYKQKASGM